MYDIEHKPEQEEPAFTPEQKDITKAGRPKLPRAWRYAIIGGTVLLVLAVIFAGILSLTNQKAKQPSQTRLASTTEASTLPTSTIGATTLPTPATKPIPASVLSDHYVNVTIAGGVAYLGTVDNAVYALRTSNGALLWRHKIDGSVDAQPLVANGVVYVTSYVGQIGPAYAYALRASDGSLLWRYSSNTYSYLSLSTTDSSVAFVASQGEISALNTSNGALLWHFATNGTGYSWPLVVNEIVYASSSLDNGPGTLYALRVSDGTPLWQYKTNGYIDTPTVANGVVYIDSGAGTLAALRASDGHQLWKQTLDANPIQQPQLVDGVLYITTTKIILPPATGNANPLQGTTDIGALLWNAFQSVPAAQTLPQKEGISSIYAVRASDGAILWHYAMNNGGYSWASWLSVEHGVVYASDTMPTNGTTGAGDIYALQSSNGSVLWHDKLNTSPSGALLANGFIYLSTSDSYSGAVYAVRTSDGSLLWNYPIAGSMYAAPILDGNVLYLGAANSIVYALRAANGVLLWHYLTQVQG